MNLGGSASDHGVFYFREQAEILLERLRTPEPEREDRWDFSERLFDVNREWPHNLALEWPHWNTDTVHSHWVEDHFQGIWVGDDRWGGIDIIGSKPSPEQQLIDGVPELGNIIYFIELKGRTWPIKSKKRPEQPGKGTSMVVPHNQVQEFQTQMRAMKAVGLPQLNGRIPYARATSAFFYYLFVYTQTDDSQIVGQQVYLVRPRHFTHTLDGTSRLVTRSRGRAYYNVSRTFLNGLVETGELVIREASNTLFNGDLTYITPAYGSFPDFSTLPLSSRESGIASPNLEDRVDNRDEVDDVEYEPVEVEPPF